MATPLTVFPRLLVGGRNQVVVVVVVVAVVVVVVKGYNYYLYNISFCFNTTQVSALSRLSESVTYGHRLHRPKTNMMVTIF